MPSTKWKAGIEIHSLIEETEIKNIISCFVCIFQSKSSAYVFFNQIYKVIIYFWLSQESF